MTFKIKKPKKKVEKNYVVENGTWLGKLQMKLNKPKKVKYKDIEGRKLAYNEVWL